MMEYETVNRKISTSVRRNRDYTEKGPRIAAGICTNQNYSNQQYGGRAVRECSPLERKGIDATMIERVQNYVSKV
jgi:hypothetical protein